MTFLSSLPRFDAITTVSTIINRFMQPLPVQQTIKKILHSPEKDVDSKRLEIFLALNRLPEKRYISVEKKIPQEYLFKKKLRLPSEILSVIYVYAFSNFSPLEIALMTMQKGDEGVELHRDGILALYTKFDWLCPKWVASFSEFKCLMHDACKYGGKTFKQVFEGFNLLKLVQELDLNAEIAPDAQIKIIMDLENAGLLEKGAVHPNSETSKFIKQEFSRWALENPAHIMACLRWLPAQEDTPFLLTEVAKHKNATIMQSMFKFMLKHEISLDLDRETAIREAVSNSDIDTVRYLFNIGADVDHLPQDTLHTAVNRECFEMTKLLVNQGIKIGEIINIPSLHRGKLPVDMVIDKLSIVFFRYFASSELRRMGENLLDILTYLVQEGQRQKVAFHTSCTPDRMGLLHLACYVKSPILRMQLATVFIEHNPQNLYARDSPSSEKDGDTPLHAAVKKGQHELITLFLQKGADVTIRAHGCTVIELAEKVGDSETLHILKGTGNTGAASGKQLDWLSPQWVSSPSELKALISDAWHYGGRTFEQIFEGFNILKLIQRAGSHAQIDLSHLQRAGILQKGWANPDDIEVSALLKTQFLEWLRANPAHIVACLRWLPAQSCIPSLLPEIAKHNDQSALESAIGFMEQHGLTLTDQAASLEQAIENACIPIAEYWFNEGISIEDLSKDILHKAVKTGCFKMVELLVEKGAKLDERGPGLAVEYDGKLAYEVAISAAHAHDFFSSSSHRQRGEERKAIANYLIQQSRKPTISNNAEREFFFDTQCTPDGMTLLDVACYLKPHEEGVKLAKLLFDKKAHSRHIGDAYISNRTPLSSSNYAPLQTAKNTPLHTAIKERHYPMVRFLFSQGAYITLTPFEYLLLRLKDPESFRILLENRHVVSVHIRHSEMALLFNRLAQRLRTLFLYMYGAFFGVKTPDTQS